MVSINWIGDDAKIKRIKRIKPVKDKLKNEIKTILDEIGKLEDERKGIEELGAEKGQKLIEKSEELEKVEKRITRLDTVLRSKYEAYKNDYKMAQNMKNWVANRNAAAPDKRINVYKLKLPNGENMETTEDEMERIIAVVSKQLESIDDDDFASKVDAKFGASTSSATTAKILLTSIKDSAKNMKKVDSSGIGDRRTEKWDFAHEMGEQPLDTDGNPDYTKPAQKFHLFPFDDLFNFMILAAPQHDKSIIKNVKNGAKKTSWFITPIGVKAPDYALASNGYPVDGSIEYYFGAGYNNAKEIQNNSLEDWVDLFWSAFEDPVSRNRFLTTFMGSTPSTVQDAANNPLLKWLADAGTTGDFKDYYQDYANQTGTIGNYYIDDVDVEIKELKPKKLKAEGEKKSLEEEVRKNAEKVSSKDVEVSNKKSEKLKVKDGEIQALIDADIKAKQKKVDDAKIDSNYKWDETDNKLKAAWVKWLLKEIKWLENGGVDNKPFKKPENKTLYDTISSKLFKDTATTNITNVLIKKNWESKGSDTKDRIEKVLSETDGYDLGFYQDTFESMGASEKAVVDAIKAKMDDEKLPDSPPVNAQVLKENFGLLSEPEQSTVDKWKKVDGVDLNSEKIKTIVGDHISDNTKKGKLIEHIKKLPDSDGIDKSSDAKILESFFKKEPKFVVETICKHEVEDDKIKKTLIKEMKDHRETKDGKENKLADDYFDASGEPKSDKIVQFLYEKKLGKAHSLKEISKKDKDEETKGGFGEHFKKYGIWYGLAAVALIAAGGAIYFFWENITKWWNPPAENTDEDKSNE